MDRGECRFLGETEKGSGGSSGAQAETLLERTIKAILRARAGAISVPL